jgi:integrase
MARDKRTYGTIRKMPSGRWQANYTNTAGRRVFAPHTFRTRVDAESFLHERRREGDSSFVRRPKITFGDYATTWLANRHVGGRPIKPRTREHYQQILTDHLLPTFGGKFVAAVTPQDVRDWHASTLVDKPTMRSHCYSLLRTIFASAVADELIDSNPARIVGAGSAKRAIVIRPASVDEIVALTAAMPERLAPMVLLASWCALRFGETIELRRHDIDLNAEGFAVIRIRRAAVRVDGRFEIGDPKSEAGSRDVAIPPHIVPVIEAHLANHVGAARDSLLFPNTTGGHLQPATLARHWDKARAKIGREDLRWHDLRHSGAVLAAATGATLAQLMARLGHSTPQAAMRYQHASQSGDRQIAELLSKIAANS